MTSGVIRIRGARQHNLKNLDLDIRTGEMTVVVELDDGGAVVSAALLRTARKLFDGVVFGR